jgi:Asp-tRNA(Asn)/Glu-tRNA(Gln) amidotransferase A subunit family amidase
LTKPVWLTLSLLLDRSIGWAHIRASLRFGRASSRELLMLSALDLARRIEAGEIGAAAVIERCGEAIAAREAEIGAFVTYDLQRARRVAARVPSDAPLHGLPVGIKDIFDTVEMPTEYGSPIYAGYRPPWDASAVSLVQRAGGIILGKTVTTEFAYLQPPKTRNPHNLAHTPGGSSSGSAAAVAAGMLPLAFGSQTGGSVIRPAAYCGVAGFKPSYKLIPTVGMKCFSWSLDTIGLFAAGVADAAFAAAAITGRDLRIDRGVPAAPRIAVVRTHIGDQASEMMQDALEQAARAAERAGATITDVALPPILAEAFDAHPTVQDYEAFRALAFEYDNHRDRLGPLLRKLLDEAANITPEAYDTARRTARRARHALADLKIEFDVMLTPSAAGAAPDIGSTGKAIFNRLWTLMGTPCVNVPGLSDAFGLPLGVQIVGRFGRDKAALEAAWFLENAIGRARD